MMIELQNVTKKYGRLVALENVSLQLDICFYDFSCV
jgi:ABC-type sugar transport system ATPase subunit